MKINIDMSYFDTKTNKSRKLPAKAEYSGPVVGSKPHGAGMMTFPSGDMYVGTFENGKCKWFNFFTLFTFLLSNDSHIL